MHLVHHCGCSRWGDQHQSIVDLHLHGLGLQIGVRAAEFVKIEAVKEDQDAADDSVLARLGKGDSMCAQ